MRSRTITRRTGKNHLSIRQGRWAIFIFILTLSAFASIGLLNGGGAAQTTCTQPPAGVVAWYPGDGNTFDLVRANHGTLQGNATYTAGHTAQAFSFDGNTDAVSIGNPEQLRLQVLTIEAWVRRASTTQATIDSADAGMIFSYGLKGYGFYILNNGRLAFGQIGVYGVDASPSGNFPELKITDTNFHHVAVVKTANQVTFYLDGVASYPRSVSGEFEFTTSAAIGGRGDNFQNSFLGSVDEITVYNRALSGEEIRAVQGASANGKCKETRIQFDRAAYPAGEASGAYTLTVRRTGDTTGASTVNYATSDGTAKAGEDYTATTGMLTFAAGEQEKKINVPITNDTAAEADENFQIALSNPTGAALGTPATATLNLFNTLAGPGRIMGITGDIYSNGFEASNTDGSNAFQLMSLKRGSSATYPSVARQTGMIAFEGCGEYGAGAGCDKGRRIFVMNGDGTGVRQVTNGAGLTEAENRPDMRPVISPDGTRIAFISGRAPALAADQSTYEAWVVNTDGTNLHQVTAKQNFNGQESYALSVAWSPDSSRIVVHAFRLDRDSDNNQAFIGSLYTYNADGTGETLLVRNMSTPVQGSIAIDWSPDGRYIVYAAKGGPFHVVGAYVLVNPQDASDTRVITYEQLGSGQPSGVAGSVRFSPDGRQLVYGHSDGTGTLKTINIDGTNRQTVLADYPFWNWERWWWPGAAIPQAGRLTLEPDPVYVFGAQSTQVTPTLYDTQGHVIFHAAYFERSATTGFFCDSNHPCTGDAAPQVTPLGLVSNANDGSGTNTLCGSNAGQIGCTLVAITTHDAILDISATKPTAFTSGAGGPGVFKITRLGNPQSPFAANALTFTFATGGTAVRDVDYTLDFSGNAVTIPANQTSVEVKVRPLGNHGDKTVILTLQPDQQNSYILTDVNSATVTIKDDGSANVLSLLSMTPDKGGDQGAVSVIVYGKNIQQGATVKLSKSGQPDIIGENTAVAANGSAIGARLNLIGKAVGVWDVVVTNPDNTTAKLSNAFTVEASTGTHIWVDLTGRDAIRASHTATTYTITYGNRGNTDAFMVPLFVLGIPKEAEVKLFVELLPMPGAPAGHETEAPVVQSGNMQAIMLFIPVVPANSVNYIRFSLRFSQIGQNTSFTLKALASPPLLEVSNSQPAQNVSGEPGASAPRLKGNVSPSTLVYNPSKFEPCYWSIFSTALNCALSFLPLDNTLECVRDILGLTISLGTTAFGGQMYGLGDGTQKALTGTSFIFSLLGTAADCLLAAGKLAGLGTAFAVMSCLASVTNTLLDIANNDCNPFTDARLDVNAGKSSDPNVKIGARGRRKKEQHYISAREPLRYSIYFENKPDATAPAQTVVVTDQLDATKMDLSTFSLGLIGFGDTAVNVPPGLKSYDTDVDLRPAKNLIVRIKAALDSSTGIVTWEFTSIDPATNQETTDPRAGFLPPNTTGAEGEGHVLFSVMPRNTLTTGAEVRNKARIVFDLNDPLDTNEWLNTIDGSLPVSHVQQAALDGCQNLNVSWSGTDTGSGVEDYTIYVSENGGPFTIWKQNTTATSAVFKGEQGKSYAFYSVAQDASGNIEDIHQIADATASVKDVTKPQITAPPPVTVQASASSAPNGLVIQDATLGQAVASDNCSAVTITRTGVPAGNLFPAGTHTITYTATDASGNQASATQTVTVTVLDDAPRLQFASAAYSASEADARATITVTRTGAANSAASVQYATGDSSGLNNCDVVTGKASARCDYTAIAGTLDFTAGQSSASFTVPIIDDVYVEGSETLTLTLSDPQGGILGAQSTITLSITDNDNVPGAPNPIDNRSFFVRLQYMDILNREPEAQGLADWLSILQNCPAGDATCDLVGVSSGFFRSPEFFQRAYYIYRFYEVGLGRKPDFAEYQRDFKLVAGFLSNAELEQRKQQFATDFSQRSEFKARYDQYDSQTRSQEYVDALSQTAGVTLSNRLQLNSELANGYKQRWDVLRAVVESPEVSQKFFNKAFVVIGYFAYLRRDPDVLYLNWMDKLDNPPVNRSYQDIYREMIRGFVESQEYRHRFGQ